MNMKTINAKSLFDLFCERFAELNNGTDLFPTVLVIEFINGEEIVFYPQECEWFKMSSSSLKAHYSNDPDYNYAYEQNAIIVNWKYDFDSIDLDDLQNQFDLIKTYTGFSNVSSINLNDFRCIIALTHFEDLTLKNLYDYEKLILNHTLSAISNLYNQYQKPVFSHLKFDKKVHTFVLHWYESKLSYHFYFDPEENNKAFFSGVLYTENDFQLMLKHTKDDQQAFFIIWLILYRVCLKLNDALVNQPLFMPNFKCYPAFFSESQQNEKYTQFAERNKNLDINEYVELLIEELETPLI